MPMHGSEEAPATTGSVSPPVEVSQPLPQTLAFSDAAKIGQAAAAAFWQAEGGNGEWLNASTGSSGTVEEDGSGASDACRPFRSLVTSIGGVHSYSGTICRGEDGASVVEIADGGEERAS
jgi:hypothetical protein